MPRRSSLELLPREILEDVHEAMYEGATIDEIVGRIRALGGKCSPSAVTRYVKRERDALMQQQKDLGPGGLRSGASGRYADYATGRRALETLRNVAARAAAALEQGETPANVDLIGALALAIRRIDGTGKSGADRESAAGRKPAPLQGWPRSPEEQKKGLSLDAVAHIRAAVEGYWGPDKSNEEGEAAFQAHWEKRNRDARDD